MNVEDFNSVEEDKNYSYFIDSVLSGFSGNSSDINNAPIEEKANPEKVISKLSNTKKELPSNKKKGLSSNKKNEILGTLSESDSQMIKSHVLLTKRELVILNVISSISNISLGELIRKAIDSYYAKYMEGYDKHSDFIEFYTLDKDKK